MVDKFTNKEQTLRIGGFVPFTLVDYPEHVSAVIFCQGCCWNCPYCHNKGLIDLHNISENTPIWDDIIAFLKRRKGLLDAVVFSGGEPLLQSYLLSAVQEVKNLGFAAVLHTNGHAPNLLSKIVPYLDWVGLDIKAPFAEYYKAICSDSSLIDKFKNLNFGEKVKESLEILLSSKIDFECRTTLDPRIINNNMLIDIAKSISAMGVKNYAIQQYRKTDNLQDQPSDREITSFFENEELLAELSSLFPNFIVRK